MVSSLWTSVAKGRASLGRSALLATALVGAGGAGACTVLRDAPAPGGEHPPGWTDPSSSNFHAKTLHATGDKVWECAECHGADYKGGAVGVGCVSQGCHQQSPTFCGTCHGSSAGPRPATGAHAIHQSYCAECHRVPSQVNAPGHIGKTATVLFSGIAVAGGSTPTWDPASKTCAGVYCHAGSTPTWEAPATQVTCDACHGLPPASHTRWSAVAGPSDCQNCHPIPPGPQHLNGMPDLKPTVGCDTCHGTGTQGAPGPALDRSSDPADPGMGAHDAHLNPTLAGRIGRVAACTDCHVVPSSVTDPGHLGTTAPARVTFPSGGTFDPASATCAVGCHWDRSPGPTWNDTSGAALACDACHGFPPTAARNGQAHTACQPTLSACLSCHVFTPETHVDGVVEFVR